MSETWLRVFGVASLSPEWKLSAEPDHQIKKLVQGRYIVTWIAPNRKVQMTIEDRTGDLLKLRVCNRGRDTEPPRTFPAARHRPLVVPST